jgi:GNAT superfamily N-acetyltransferase
MPSLTVADGAALERILDDTYSLWGEGLSRSAYGQWNAAQMRTPWGRHHLRRYALVESGQVLASAKRYDLVVQLDGRRVPTLGVGAVFTPSENRGRGYATRMIESLCDTARADGAQLAMLFSEIGPEYYQRLGFVPVPMTISDVQVHIKTGGPPAVLVRTGHESDAAHIADMHAHQAGRYRFALLPDADQVNFSIARRRMLSGFDQSGHRAVEYFVVEEGQRAVAFILIQLTRHPRPDEPDAWSVAACGDRDPEGARIGAMLQVLRARTPAATPPIIRAWWPRGFHPPQLTLVPRASALEVLMLRPLVAPLRIEPALTEQDIFYWHGDAF